MIRYVYLVLLSLTSQEIACTKNYSSTDVADNTAQLHFGLGAGIIYATEPLNKAHQNCESFSGEKV